MQTYEDWKHVLKLGFLNKGGITKVLSEPKARLIILQLIVSLMEALPIKMLQDMAANLPVIASNFPLWHRIVEANESKLCVDPPYPNGIATTPLII